VRVAAIASELGALFQLGEADLRSLYHAALAHDAGMIAMRRDYIARAGTLTEEERRDLARHAVVGEGEAARLGLDRPAQLIIRWHHESWNGDGYPDGLREMQIPLPARILHVADVYSALTDSRPSRPARTQHQALQIMRESAGLDFDPLVIHRLLTLTSHSALASFADSSSIDSLNQTAFA
jgi:HD-GYP domain-containing protein (c-di-GMP phosphodiesterase class II)